MFQPLTFEEDPVFTEKALRLIGDDGIFAIQMFLYDRPDAGDIIPGSGGCRKLRWAAKGHGKRGGSRVIYYWITEDNRILLLDIYAKNQCENPSQKHLSEYKRKVRRKPRFPTKAPKVIVPNSRLTPNLSNRENKVCCPASEHQREPFEFLKEPMAALPASRSTLNPNAESHPPHGSPCQRLQRRVILSASLRKLLPNCWESAYTRFAAGNKTSGNPRALHGR